MEREGVRTLLGPCSELPMWLSSVRLRFREIGKGLLAGLFFSPGTFLLVRDTDGRRNFAFSICFLFRFFLFFFTYLSLSSSLDLCSLLRCPRDAGLKFRTAPFRTRIWCARIRLYHARCAFERLCLRRPLAGVRQIGDPLTNARQNSVGERLAVLVGSVWNPKSKSNTACFGATKRRPGN